MRLFFDTPIKNLVPCVRITQIPRPFTTKIQQNSSINDPEKNVFKLFSNRQNFRLVRIESFCRRQNKCDLKTEFCFLED